MPSLSSAVITHEVGHALKLCHTSEWDTSTNTLRQQEYKHTFPSNMQPYLDEYNGIDINWAKQHVGSYTLTAFDKSALISKGGK